MKDSIDATGVNWGPHKGCATAVDIDIFPLIFINFLIKSLFWKPCNKSMTYPSEQSPLTLEVDPLSPPFIWLKIQCMGKKLANLSEIAKMFMFTWWETPAASSCRAPVSRIERLDHVERPDRDERLDNVKRPEHVDSSSVRFVWQHKKMKIVRIQCVIAQKNRIDSLIINLVRKWKNIEIWMYG